MLKPLNLVSKYSNMEQDRLFRFQPFKLPNSTALRSIGVYTSGALVCISVVILVIIQLER